MTAARRATEPDPARALLRRAERGSGGVVLVEGDPGSGKSALLRACAAEAAGRGFCLVEGAASWLERSLPLATLRGAIPGLFDARDAGDASQDAGDASQDAADVKVRRFLQRRAAAGPVLVCLDDMQWACPGTLAVVRALSRDLRHEPVAWLLAWSGAPASPAAGVFRALAADGADRVALAPLTAAAVTEALADAFGGQPDAALAELAAGAGGNPSLLAELTGGLRAENAVRVTGGRAELASDRVPARVIALSRRRLSALTGPARHLVATAAVLDPEFRFEDVARMLARPAAALRPALDEAVAAGIMTGEQASCGFRHPLLRRAIAETIPGPARRALHRQYGEILLARTESAALAASHLLRAAQPGDGRSAAGLGSAAARVARLSPEAAADLAVRALELTPATGPDTVARAVTAAEALAAAGRRPDAERIARQTLTRPLAAEAEIRLRCVLSAAACAAGRPAEAAGLAELALTEPVPSADVRDQALAALLRARTALRDPRAAALAATVLATRTGYGRTARTAALASRALADLDAGRIGDGVGLLRTAVHERARDAGPPPDARQVRPPLLLAAVLTDLRLLPEAAGLLHGNQDGPALSVLRARAHLAAGELDRADAAARAARTLAGERGAGGVAAAASCVLAVSALRRGDVAAAARHLDDRTVTGPQFADVYARAETALAVIQVREAGEGAAAVLDALRELCAGLEAGSGPLLGDPAAAAWLARTALAAGDADLAAAVAGAAMALAAGWPQYTALAAAADHARGVISGDAAALASAAARQPDPWGRASAAEDLGVLLARQGAKDAASARLKEALAGYEQAGAGRDQARVRRRLRALGVRRRHWAAPVRGPVTGWEALTATEQAVARLVAEGLSNAQVAARMYISTHTVAHHLRQSYRKLAITSRVELTRVVVGQQ